MRFRVITGAFVALFGLGASSAFASKPNPAPNVAIVTVAVSPTDAPPSPAPATVAPAAAPAGPYLASDGSIRYTYTGSVQPTLTCKPLYVCDVTLESGETILNLAIGDSVRWVVAAAQSGANGAIPHVFIKPTETNLQTNLLITTTKRVYYLRLMSNVTAVEPSRISYAYPEEEAADAAAREAARLAAAAERASDLPLVPPDQLDYNYKLAGAREIVPAKVYNDGVHSYIQYNVLPTDLPVVYAVAPDGSDQIVNYRLKDTIFIVDGIPTGFDLVLNGGTGKHGRGERRAFVRHN